MASATAEAPKKSHKIVCARGPNLCIIIAPTDRNRTVVCCGMVLFCPPPLGLFMAIFYQPRHLYTCACVCVVCHTIGRIYLAFRGHQAIGKGCV